MEETAVWWLSHAGSHHKYNQAKVTQRPGWRKVVPTVNPTVNPRRSSVVCQRWCGFQGKADKYALNSDFIRAF